MPGAGRPPLSSSTSSRSCFIGSVPLDGRVELAVVEELREDLGAFCAEVLASVPRKYSRVWSNCYLRGLMLDGRRKSIQPMAERLPDGNMQALQEFVGQSPREHAPGQRRLGRCQTDLDRDRPA
ncbi:transposase [Nocardiopsis sp. NPDC058631]|uniref:transposase n=1 Tax=Nocardiopsis sp. NPDC058631 TaxID=3346566 RepID=UPI0036620EBA